ncbi:MAG: type II secretion system protein M [Burkholderiaceae bacterium]|nr:type II secretion system protein M [Burkholderiaceae bacterium]
MKIDWKNQLARINALSLRERVMLFVSVAFVMIALADTLVWSPAAAKRKSLLAEQAASAKELATLRQTLADAGATSQPDSPRGQLLARIAQSRAELQTVDSQIRENLGDGKRLASLPGLMDQVLRRHERLTLTHLVTSNDRPVDKSADTSSGETALRWQAVDLGVSGGYLDLVQYLADLERALPELRWGPMEINSKQTPPELTVRLFLAGDAR